MRNELLVLLTGAMVLLWVLAGASFYIAARAQQRQLLDDSLGSASALLLRLVQHEVDEHGPLLSAELIRVEQDRPAHDLRFQIWLRATPTSPSELIYRSEGVAATPLGRENGEGFDWFRQNGRRLRTVSLWNHAHTLQVQVAESAARGTQLAGRSLTTLAVAALALLPLSTLLIWLIITRSLEPLANIANIVERRAADDLSPVPSGARAPREVAPLLRSLNSVLARVRRLLERERQFTADAAHELRTPLAAIRVNAQVLRAARDDRERDEAAAGVIAGVDRGSHVIDQLLALARVDDANALSASWTEVSLAELIQDQCVEQAAFARRRAITLQDASTPVSVRGSPAQLAILLRNLVDNAIRHGPTGKTVTLGCGIDSLGAVELWVEDCGPGVPPEQRERMFERFYRASESGQYGSGLGLAIVRRIADLHRARVEVLDRDPPPGLRMRVCFALNRE